MKQINTKNIIKFAIILIIIISGIIMIAVKGFKFDLNYETAQKLEIYIGKQFEVKEIKEITDEVLKDKNVVIEKVEIFEDMVSIKTKEITDEEKSNIVSKINEKYSLENKVEETNIVTVPHTRFIDIHKKYVLPLISSLIIILIYTSIRFRKIGITKSLLYILLTVGVSELLLMSVIAIARIPVGKISTLLILFIYVISVICATSNLENKLMIEKNKEESE